MAIGSGEELGVVFGKWGEMTEAEQELWCATFRSRFGDNLLKGYATLNYPPNRKPYGDTQKETHLSHQ
jgi:hypothetical protein